MSNHRSLKFGPFITSIAAKPKAYNGIFFPIWTQNTPGRRQSKTSILSKNVDKKLLEIEFMIAICHPIGDKWQLKTLFLAIFDPPSSIVKSDFDGSLPGVLKLDQISGACDQS